MEINEMEQEYEYRVIRRYSGGETWEKMPPTRDKGRAISFYLQEVADDGHEVVLQMRPLISSWQDVPVEQPGDASPKRWPGQTVIIDGPQAKLPPSPPVVAGTPEVEPDVSKLPRI